MAEPNTTNYPVSYEDDSSILAPPVDRAVGTLKSAVSVADLQCTLNEDFQTYQGDPTFIVFEGGEIWFVDDADISFASEETTITLSEFSQRGAHNSPVQPHTQGEKVYFGISHTHINQFRLAIEALQKNGFLYGTDAQRQAYSPLAGEGWLTSDTHKVYFCFVATNWVWVSRISHQDLDGRGDDDHNDLDPDIGYQNDARASSWHSGLSTFHIPFGDDHDHYSTNEGAAVLRVAGGVDTSKGAATFIGHIYFSTDIDGGTLFISSDGSDWDKISGAPSGAIAMFDIACPSGWTRYTALDGKYPRMDSVSPGGTGGSLTHKHDFSVFVEHYHTIDAVDATNVSYPGNHSHPVTMSGGGSGTTYRKKSGLWTGYAGTTQTGTHTHDFTLPQQDTDTGGDAGVLDTSLDNQEPPYKETIFCEKD